eukprot:6196541-Pleurochrysis_carterae.AAC.2
MNSGIENEAMMQNQDADRVTLKSVLRIRPESDIGECNPAEQTVFALAAAKFYAQFSSRSALQKRTKCTTRRVRETGPRLLRSDALDRPIRSKRERGLQLSQALRHSVERVVVDSRRMPHGRVRRVCRARRVCRVRRLRGGARQLAQPLERARKPSCVKHIATPRREALRAAA